MKCGHTLSALTRLGALDDFADVFNLRALREVRAKFLGEHVLKPKKSGSPLPADLRVLAAAQRYAFVPSERLLGAAAAVLPPSLFDRLALAVFPARGATSAALAGGVDGARPG